MCCDRTPAVRAEFHAALERWMRVENRSAEEEENSGDKTVAARSNAAAPEDPSSPEDPMDHDDPMALSAASSRLPPGCALPHAPVFLPMLLTGVADEAEGNAARALALVEAVGEENAARLRDGRSRRKKTQSESAGEGDDDPDEAAARLLTLRALLLRPRSRSRRFPAVQFPASAPPSPSRRLVRAILPSLIRRSCAEAREWTASRRNAGAKLLATVCAFAGAAASDHLDEIFAACHSAVQDELADTAARVLGAARCVGAHCPGEQWLPFSLDAICAEERGKGPPVGRREPRRCACWPRRSGAKPADARGARSAEVLTAGGAFGGGGGADAGGVLRAPRARALSRRTTPAGGARGGRRHRRRRPARGRPRADARGASRTPSARGGAGRSGSKKEYNSGAARVRIPARRGVRIPVRRIRTPREESPRRRARSASSCSSARRRAAASARARAARRGPPRRRGVPRRRKRPTGRRYPPRPRAPRSPSSRPWRRRRSGTSRTVVFPGILLRSRKKGLFLRRRVTDPAMGGFPRPPLPRERSPAARNHHRPLFSILFRSCTATSARWSSRSRGRSRARGTARECPGRARVVRALLARLRPRTRARLSSLSPLREAARRPSTGQTRRASNRHAHARGRVRLRARGARGEGGDCYRRRR